jgi:hypothetical protein
MEITKYNAEEKSTEKYLQKMHYYIDAMKISIIGGFAATFGYLLQNKDLNNPIVLIPPFVGIALNGIFLKKYANAGKKLKENGQSPGIKKL